MSDSDNIVLLLEVGVGADPDTANVIAANAAFRRTSGYSDAQVVGRAATDLFPNADDAAALMDAIRGPGFLRSELTCRRANGDSFVLGLHLMPAPERTPGAACYLILGRDITSVLQARQMQDSIQRLLAKVFASVDAAVAIVNVAGRIVMTNPSVDLLLGYKANGLVGRIAIDLVAPGSRAHVAAMLKQHLETGADTTYATAVIRADGSELLVRVTSVIAVVDTRQFRILTVRPEALNVPGVRSESVGRIKLVGLDAVRSALGDRWPEVAERAMATAEVVIRRNCGPQDSFSRVDDTSFLICFGELSEEESSFRAAMIGREIRNRLIGQGEDPENAYVRAVAAVVRIPDQGEAESAVQAKLLEGLDRQLERLEQESRQILQDAMATATCELDPVFGRNSRQVVASQVLIPARLERQLVSALFALPQKESKNFDPDCFLLGLAAQHAVVSMAQGDTLPLLVRIGFDMFGSRLTTERFFALCEKIDRRVTTRLVLLLASVPDGVPRTRLQDCVNRLRPFCRGVGYQADEVAQLPEIDLSTSFNPVVSLPVSACSASTPRKLKELFGSLQARRVKILIRDVGSEKDAAALRALGVDMIALRRVETEERDVQA